MYEDSRATKDSYPLADCLRTLREYGAHALVNELETRPLGSRNGCTSSNGLGALIERCRQAPDRRTIRQLLREFAPAFAADHATIHRIQAPSGCAFLRSLETTYPKPWLLRYTFKGYAVIDPVLRTTETWKAFFFWDEIDHREKDTQKFWDDAQQHGIGPSGATEVAKLAPGWTLAVSLASRIDSEAFRAGLQPILSDFRVAARAICESFCRINGFAGVQGLSQEDLEYLCFIWEGGTRRDFVSRNGKRTCVLEADITRKLACTSFDQALVLAGKIGLVEAPDFLLQTVLEGS